MRHRDALRAIEQETVKVGYHNRGRFRILTTTHDREIYIRKRAVPKRGEWYLEPTGERHIYRIKKASYWPITSEAYVISINKDYDF